MTCGYIYVRMLLIGMNIGDFLVASIVLQNIIASYIIIDSYS